MAETLIFPEQTLEGVIPDSGIWYWDAEPAPLALTTGETYRVVLDGVPHELVCVDEEGAAVLAHYVLDESSGDPEDGSFAIQYGSPELMGNEGGAVVAVVFDSAEELTHTLALYQVSPEILLGDHTAADLAHTRPDRLRVRTSEGGTTEYVHERLVPVLLEEEIFEPDFSGGDYAINLPAGMALQSAVITKPEALLPENIREGVSIAGIDGTASIPETVETTVELDFSGGDMTVTPDSGKAFSSVSIPKPANLVPELIAVGTNIAGIVGTMPLGGGGATQVVFGKFTPTGAAATIFHNMGTVPFFAGVFANESVSDGLIFAHGFSAAMYDEGYSGYAYSTALQVAPLVERALDSAETNDVGLLTNANKMTMSVGSASGFIKLDTSVEYVWFAVGTGESLEVVEYQPSLTGFVRQAGTINTTSGNYLQTEYIELDGADWIEYNSYVMNTTNMATWALFDADKKWLVSSDDEDGTDYYHVDLGGGEIDAGFVHRTLSVAELLASYPTAAYVVMSTCVHANYEIVENSAGVNVGWSSDDAYIRLYKAAE